MHRLGIKNMHKVWDDESNGNSLYLGDYYAASNYTKLKESKITGLLTAAAGLGITHQDTSINHKIYNAWDMPSYNISRHFDDAFQFIDNHLKKGNILVHCAAGISRSATLVIMYLMKKNGWDLKKTVSYVRGKRSIICPNYGFMKHLQNFEKSLGSNLRKSKMGETKKQEFKEMNSKSQITNNVSDLTATRKSFNQTFNKQKSLKQSKLQVNQLLKAYSNKTSSSTKKTSIRPYSVQKPSSHFSSSKGSSVPAWKRFLQSTKPVAPRIVTIKP